MPPPSGLDASSRADPGDRRLGTALAIGAAVIFGAGYVATAFAMRSFSPLAVAVWRGLGALSLLLLLFAARRGVIVRAVRDLDRVTALRIGLLGVLSGPGLIAGMNLAVAGVGASVAAFVAGMYSVLAAVLAPLVLGERLGRAPLAGFVAALAGTALLAEIHAGPSTLPGVAAGLGAAICYALFLVLSRRWSSPRWSSLPLRPDLVTVVSAAATVMVLLPVDLFLDRRGLAPGSLDGSALVGVAWLVVGPSIVATLMIQAAVRRIPARRSSAMILFNPLAATLLSALMLGERLSAVQLAGAALVLGGIALSTGVLRLPIRRSADARKPDDDLAAADLPDARPPAA